MIDTKALRSRILDLAIRGKLTKQLAGEKVETESITILVNSPYSIPNNWRWTTIQSIISKDVGGGTPSKSVADYWNNGVIPWMSVKDFSSAKNGFLNDTIDHITQAGLDNSSSNLVDENSIIICMRMALGKIVKIKKPMAINQDLRAIWLKHFIDNDYFVYFYSTLKVEGHGMTVSGISKKQLMNYPFPLPPLAEQKRIVERVEEIFRLLDAIDEAQEKYSADSQILKAKLITAGIQGKLTKQLPSDGTAEELYQQIQAEKQKLIKEGKIKKEKPLPAIKDEEIPFEIPGNWKWCRLGEISNTIWAGRDKPNDFTEEADELRSVPVVANGVANDGILGYTGTATAPANTITVAGRGTIGFSVFRTYEYCPIVRLVVIEQAQQIEPRYLQYYLKLVPATSVGSSIPQLTVPMIRPKLVPLPPLAEQKRIVEVLERVMGTIH